MRWFDSYGGEQKLARRIGYSVSARVQAAQQENRPA